MKRNLVGLAMALGVMLGMQALSMETAQAGGDRYRREARSGWDRDCRERELREWRQRIRWRERPQRNDCGDAPRYLRARFDIDFQPGRDFGRSRDRRNCR